MKKYIQTAPVSCARSILVDSSAVEVWEVLTTIDKWPEWNTDIAKSQLFGPLQEGSTFRWKTSGLSIQSTLHTVIPYTHFGWSGKTLGMHATHNWYFTEHKKYTEVIVEESLEGFLPRIFKSIFTKVLEKNMQKWLELLKQQCERKQKLAA